MHVEQLPSVEDVVSTLEAGRQRLSEADLVGASRSALTSARDALPERWTRRRRASRWPLVAGVILGATMLGLLLRTPAVRRRAASVWASCRTMRGTADPTSIPDLPAADEPTILALPAQPDAAGVPPPDGSTEIS